MASERTAMLTFKNLSLEVDHQLEIERVSLALMQPVDVVFVDVVDVFYQKTIFTPGLSLSLLHTEALILPARVAPEFVIIKWTPIICI
jgi:hypothetical protein